MQQSDGYISRNTLLAQWPEAENISQRTIDGPYIPTLGRSKSGFLLILFQEEWCLLFHDIFLTIVGGHQSRPTTLKRQMRTNLPWQFLTARDSGRTLWEMG